MTLDNVNGKARVLLKGVWQKQVMSHIQHIQFGDNSDTAANALGDHRHAALVKL